MQMWVKHASHGVDLSVNYNHWFNNKIWLQGYGNFTYATSEFKVADEPDYAAPDYHGGQESVTV